MKINPHVWYLLSVATRLGFRSITPECRVVTHNFDWLSMRFERP